jgi:hypothetical protein
MVVGEPPDADRYANSRQNQQEKVADDIFLCYFDLHGGFLLF